MLLDANPVTGEKVWFQYDEHTEQMTITHEQDVEPMLDMAHAMAIDSAYTKDGIKRDHWHYAHVPNIIIMEMKNKHGVDFFDKNDRKRVFQLLNTEYKRFKTTEMTHNVR